MIQGKDLVGGEVSGTHPCGPPSVILACAITRAQSHKVKDVVDLSQMSRAPQEDVVESVGPPEMSELSADG